MRWMPFALLVGSNLFMTYAWYGHLRDLRDKPLLWVIAASWGVALFEYCLQVPANRIGIQYFSLPQLKVAQEIIVGVRNHRERATRDEHEYVEELRNGHALDAGADARAAD